MLPPRYTAARAAGWSSQVARRAHNPEVAGSNPAPAIGKKPQQTSPFFGKGSCVFRRNIPCAVPPARYLVLMRGSKRERHKGVWEVRAYLGRDPITGKQRQ